MEEKWREDKTLGQIVGSLRRFGLKKKHVTDTIIKPVEEVKILMKMREHNPIKIKNLIQENTVSGDSLLE
jgi:hypothetical protein